MEILIELTMEDLINDNWQQDTMNFIIPSTMEHLWQARKSLLEFLESQGVDDPFEIEIVFRELLDNAIRHGNQQNADLFVRALVERLADGAFRIEMEDQGPGFDYAKATQPEFNNHTRCRRRGYLLINFLTEHLEFNTTGNTVVAHVRPPVGLSTEFGMLNPQIENS